jgi:nitronate monooxygenase
VLGVRFPLIQAPMAGGPDSPALAAAVSEAGALGSLGCAYLTPEKLSETVQATRTRTQRPFAVNLFVREDPPDDAAGLQRVTAALAPFRRELGLSVEPAPRRPLPAFDAQLEAVLRLKPHLFSFTFGIPSPAQLAALRAAGILIVGTATSLAEGEALQAAGVDAVCAQGSEAGGHRGTFIGRAEDALTDALTLTRQLVSKLHVPVIGAGGVMDGAAIRALLDAGAVAAQLGTAFMLCPEAGTHPAHRQSLKSEAARETVVTRAFSGRAARGIKNRFSEAFGDAPGQTAPTTFPQHQALTAELRAAAAAQARTDLMQLWSGQGAPRLRQLPAAELVATLMHEAGLSAPA